MDNYRIESKEEIETYLARLRYALDHGASLSIQRERRIDGNREERYTNKYTIDDLFPNEDRNIAIRRELKRLTSADYLRTVRDFRFPMRSEMREFGKVYNGTEDVYIKIRVELLATDGVGAHTVFVMSFHYAMIPFEKDMFPYRKEELYGDS